MAVELKEKTRYKTFRAEVRGVDEEQGIVDMLIPVSTESLDRDGEVIKVEAWQKTLPKFKKRPILLSSHDYRDLRKQIGEFKQMRLTEEGLLGRPHYYINEGNQEADWAFNLAKKGVAAFSVGFIPIAWIDGDGNKEPKRTYQEVELLEISQVLVPSNQEAIQGVRAKSANPIILGLCDEVEKKLITKPEETDDFIRIPVRECDVTATIDISKKEGIKALYCGKEKKVRTYMFDKRDPFNWTMARAKAWVKEHDSGKQIDEEGIEMKLEEKAAIPYKRTPLADEGTGWDAAREVREAEVDDLKIMCAIVEGDPENKTSYKLPHHKANGEHPCIWRAVVNCAAILMGARGGVDAPPASIAGAKTHIGKHYQDFDKGEPPWEKGISQSEIRDELNYAKSLIVKEGMNEEVAEEAWNTVREIMGIRGSQIPLDICAKVGAVLNQKNRDRLEQIKSLAQQVLDSAEHEPEKTVEPKLSLEQIEGIINSTITSVIRKAQGKIN